MEQNDKTNSQALFWLAQLIGPKLLNLALIAQLIGSRELILHFFISSNAADLLADPTIQAWINAQWPTIKKTLSSQQIEDLFQEILIERRKALSSKVSTLFMSTSTTAPSPSFTNPSTSSSSSRTVSSVTTNAVSGRQASPLLPIPKSMQVDWALYMPNSRLGTITTVEEEHLGFDPNLVEQISSFLVKLPSKLLLGSFKLAEKTKTQYQRMKDAFKCYAAEMRKRQDVIDAAIKSRSVDVPDSVTGCLKNPWITALKVLWDNSTNLQSLCTSRRLNLDFSDAQTLQKSFQLLITKIDVIFDVRSQISDGNKRSVLVDAQKELVKLYHVVLEKLDEKDQASEFTLITELPLKPSYFNAEYRQMSQVLHGYFAAVLRERRLNIQGPFITYLKKNWPNQRIGFGTHHYQDYDAFQAEALTYKHSIGYHTRGERLLFKVLDDLLDQSKHKEDDPNYDQWKQARRDFLLFYNTLVEKLKITQATPATFHWLNQQIEFEEFKEEVDQTDELGKDAARAVLLGSKKFSIDVSSSGFLRAVTFSNSPKRSPKVSTSSSSSSTGKPSSQQPIVPLQTPLTAAQTIHFSQPKYSNSSKALSYYNSTYGLFLAIESARRVQEHDKKNIHRDVKPNNLCLDTLKQEVVLIDGEFLLQNHNQASRWRGSPAFFAPEFFTKCQYTPTIDCFALAGVMISLITREESWRKRTKAVSPYCRFFSGELIRSRLAKFPAWRKRMQQDFSTPFDLDKLYDLRISNQNKEQLINVISALMDQDPKNQPPLKSVIDTLQAILDQENPYFTRLMEKFKRLNNMLQILSKAEKKPPVNSSPQHTNYKKLITALTSLRESLLKPLQTERFSKERYIVLCQTIKDKLTPYQYATCDIEVAHKNLLSGLCIEEVSLSQPTMSSGNLSQNH
jgi:hypothetical protein